MTRSRTKLHGIIHVSNLCKVLRLPNSFADTAVSYYESVFYFPLCHFARKEKEVIECCVYITCRQHSWPLTVATISSLVYSSYEVLTSVFLELVQALKMDVPSISLQDLAKSHCQSFRLFQDCSSSPKNYAESPDKALARSFQILELASETWLVTGHQPIPMITTAVYLSWQFLKPVQCRSCTYSQFCKLSEIEKPPPVVLRLKEAKEICLKLSAQLPWLKMLHINKNNVVYHLGDILKHRTYLFRKALEEVEMSTTKSEESKFSALQHPSAAFLPTCMTKPRKRSHAIAFPNNLQDITGDEDISDSERAVSEDAS
ncbi:unnamed protein product [Ranitomeya imitator]|uniref:Uncharacterized protein n=1 Tax=Ranitomeya imitator TaxID=111125 RepID=A0ABN9MNL1_9NEOB|nr:unnamed protein product [Ranitomeya imitator]